jgi:hypothetical protein
MIEGSKDRAFQTILTEQLQPQLIVQRTVNQRLCVPASPAIAFANNVFPVPGGPQVKLLWVRLLQV